MISNRSNHHAEREAYPHSGHPFTRAELLSVAPRSVAEALDTVTQCSVFDFRTDVKTHILSW